MAIRPLHTSLKLLAALMLILPATGALAQQADIQIEVAQPNITDYAVAGVTTLDFYVHVVNKTNAKIQLYARRITNELPTSEWSTIVCYGEKCFDPETNDYSYIEVTPGESPYCKVTVSKPMASTAQSRVVIEFRAGMMGEPQTLEIIGVDPRGTSGVEESAGRLASLLTAYPNPASATMTITLPENITAPASLVVFNAQGQVVADLTESARTAVASQATILPVSVETLATGAYFYRLETSRQSYAGSFSVVR